MGNFVTLKARTHQGHVESADGNRPILADSSRPIPVRRLSRWLNIEHV